MTRPRLIALALAMTALHARALAGQVTLSASGVVGRAGSSLLVGGQPEEGTGIWYGGLVVLNAGRISVEGSGLRGKLSPASGSAGFDQDAGEMRGILSVRALSWLSVEGGYTIRAFDSPAGYQKWTLATAGARIMTTLGTPNLTGYARAAYVVSATVSGRAKPDVGLTFEAGFRLLPASAAPALSLFYRFERFDFPGATPVLEHVDMIGLSLGLKLGR